MKERNSAAQQWALIWTQNDLPELFFNSLHLRASVSSTVKQGGHLTSWKSPPALTFPAFVIPRRAWVENHKEETPVSSQEWEELLAISILGLGSSWTLLPVARQLQAKDDGRQQGGQEMPCQRGLRLPLPHPSPPHLVKHLVNWFTYNAATGSIIKEGVLVLYVVPGDTKKAGQFISLSLSRDYCHPRPRANL